MVRKGVNSSEQSVSPGEETTARKGRRLRRPSSLRQPVIDVEELACPLHEHRSFEFLCTNSECLQELCALCLLAHKQHIDCVLPLCEVLRQNFDLAGEGRCEELVQSLERSQASSLKELELFAERVKLFLSSAITGLKERIISEDEKIARYIQTYSEMRERFVARQLGCGRLDSQALGSLKVLMRSQTRLRLNNFIIEENIARSLFSKALTDNVALETEGQSLNSTARGVPKFLHWFEWEKRDLHLFDVVNYSHRVLKLAIYFKIPPFSRSIVIPDGRVFLLGGEDSEAGARREVYCLNLQAANTESTLIPRAPMPGRRFDFSVCFLAGFIYAICGKGPGSEVLDTCDRYDVLRDSWTPLAKANRKRYAASSVAAAEVEKIYLFGGRSSLNNQMAEDIEEYSISTNSWRIIQLKNPADFVPVEVCCAVQVQPSKIIIFGGSDSSVHDCATTYLFSFPDFAVERVGSLKKAHVFVSAPFVHGSQVFAVGNEYYVKNRNIHRFNIDTHEWDLIY